MSSSKIEMSSPGKNDGRLNKIQSKTNRPPPNRSSGGGGVGSKSDQGGDQPPNQPSSEEVGSPTIDIVLVFKERLKDDKDRPPNIKNPMVVDTEQPQSLNDIVKGRSILRPDGSTVDFESVVRDIHRAGLYTIEVRSERKWCEKEGLGYVYIGVGATERRLMMVADDIKYKLLGNPQEMKRMAEAGRPGVWEPIFAVDNPNWERTKYPAVEKNSKFEQNMKTNVYNQMKTSRLPSLAQFQKDGWDATVKPPLTPYECIYLPMETFAICMKPGLNPSDPSERQEMNVRLVCPPSKLNEYCEQQDPKREYNYDLYARTSKGSLFRTTDRERLVMHILNAPKEERMFGISNGAGIDLPMLLREKVVKDSYCLHDVEARDVLLRRWGGLSACCVCCQKTKHDDVDDEFSPFLHRETSRNLWLIRDYFGETAAMYFGFVEYLIRSTYYISILGIGMFIWQIVSFFAEIERRNIAGFVSATNTTKEEALQYLTASCTLYNYAEKMGNTRVSSAMCPAEFFNLDTALSLYNQTSGTNFSKFNSSEEITQYVVKFENEWTFNSTAALPFLALIVWIYTVLVVLFWRRRQQRYAMEWGTTGCEEDEKPRWSYVNHPDTHKAVNPIDGSISQIMYPCRRCRILCRTRSAILFLLIIVFAGVTGVVVLRAALKSSVASDELRPYAGVICGIANSVWITVMALVWERVSVSWNDAENWSTDTEWEDALTLKTFIFSFVNNYAGCFFIMFVQVQQGIAQEWLGSDDVFVFGQCGEKNGGCMRVLGVNLVVVFISKLIMGNIFEIYTIVKGSRNGENIEEEDDDNDGVDDEMTAAQSKVKYGVILHPMERDHFLPKYTPFSRIYDYLEVVILYGFVAFFILSFPAACLLPVCLLAWQLELVIDCTKIATGHRKSLPTKAEDIGMWEDIIVFMCWMSLVSNAYQLCYVAKFDYTLGFVLEGDRRIWFFWGLIAGGIFFYKIAERLVPAIPANVSLQVARAEHLATKLVFNRPDDNFQEEDAARHEDLSSVAGIMLVNRIFRNFFPEGADRPKKELFGIHKEVHDDVHHLLSTVLSHHVINK